MDAGVPGASFARTSGSFADGEVVWSWRPDAGAKLAGSDLQVTGQESPVPGESPKETVKTIARGRPDDWLNLW
jgi:hypothetical protein